MFNRVHAMVRWAEMSNMMSVIADCPHRERLAWLEQSNLRGPSFWYGYDMRPLFGKNIGDTADCQAPGGLIPTCAPDYLKVPAEVARRDRVGQRGRGQPVAEVPVDGRCDVPRQN